MLAARAAGKLPIKKDVSLITSSDIPSTLANYILINKYYCKKLVIDTGELFIQHQQTHTLIPFVLTA